MIYGQQELVKDLVALRLGYGAPLHFEVADVSLADLDDVEHRGRALGTSIIPSQDPGRVEVDSAEGAGTTFRVYLPIQEGPR